MKRCVLSILLIFLFIACNGVKKAQQAINAGDYTSAINEALQKLTENKEKKGHQPYILLLEDAFKKNAARELDNIIFLEKDGNEASYESIYKGYVNLRNIQERIRPLLPLQIIEEDRAAQFSFDDYDNDIIEYKDDLSEYLYDNAEGLLLNATRKTDYRKAYDDFVYLDEINPGFEDTSAKIEEALLKGIDYIDVKVLNNSNQIIPVALSQELLDFNTYGLDDLWTKYHTTSVQGITYSYFVQVTLLQIDISPEQLREKEIIREKLVKDGYKYVQNEAGEFVKDSLGNKIQVDKFKTVRSKLRKFTQFKSAQVAGNVSYYDLQTDQQINTYPLTSAYTFEHEYAVNSGDRRAMDNEFTPLLERVAIPFPTNEQMVYDAAEDLKAQLKNILIQHRFK